MSTPKQQHGYGPSRKSTQSLQELAQKNEFSSELGLNGTKPVRIGSSSVSNTNGTVIQDSNVPNQNNRIGNNNTENSNNNNSNSKINTDNNNKINLLPNNGASYTGKPTTHIHTLHDTIHVLISNPELMHICWMIISDQYIKQKLELNEYEKIALPTIIKKFKEDFKDANIYDTNAADERNFLELLSNYRKNNKDDDDNNNNNTNLNFSPPSSVRKFNSHPLFRGRGKKQN